METGSGKNFRKGFDIPPSKVRSCRLIQLLPVLSKIIEKITLSRLLKYTEHRPEQFGFVPGRGTVDAIQELLNKFRTSRYQYCLAIFVDIQDAFDHVWWPGVLQILQSGRCPANLYNLIKSYFIKRKVLYVGCQGSVTRKLERRCPQ